MEIEIACNGFMHDGKLRRAVGMLKLILNTIVLKSLQAISKYLGTLFIYYTTFFKYRMCHQSSLKILYATTSSYLTI